MALTLIFDVDGTLVDTNYHHAIAWHRAFREHNHSLPLWRIHRHVGMGGDQFVPALIDEEADADHGDAIRDAHARAYDTLIGEIEPLPGARELLEELHDDGLPMVLASSARAAEVDHYLDLLKARERVAAWTTSADVERTKPAPDLVRAALDKADEEGPWLMVGDTVWDAKAAAAAGIPMLGVLTGGFAEAELREAGAAEVVESVDVLREERHSLAALAT